MSAKYCDSPSNRSQNVSKKSWRTVIPTIRKPGAEIWVTFNPELETDDTYQRVVVNPPAGAVVVRTSFRDNPALSEELRIEIEHLKATDPDQRGAKSQMQIENLPDRIASNIAPEPNSGCWLSTGCYYQQSNSQGDDCKIAARVNSK